MKKLSKDARLILFTHTLFILSTALSSTFVNVFIWKLTSDFKVIGTYNIIVYAMVMITFMLAGFLFRKKSLPFCSILGILCFIVFYLVVIVSKENVTNYLYLAAFFCGCGNGFYFVAYNSYIYYYTNVENRSNYLGKVTGTTSIMLTIAPAMAGFIISRMDNFDGYYVIFTISLLLFAITCIGTLLLNKVVIQGEYNLVKVFREADKDLYKISSGYFFTGFREGALNYVTVILVCMILKDELMVGQFTTLTSVLSIFCAFFVGSVVSKNNRLNLIFIGSIMCFVSTLILISLNNFWGILINGVLLALFTNLWGIPHNVITYEVLGNNTDNGKSLADLIIMKEIFINVGRISGILLYIFACSYLEEMVTVKVILPILSASLLANYVLVKSIFKPNFMMKTA